MYKFGIFSSLSFLAAFVYFLTAVYVFSKAPKARVNRIFLLVALTMAIWGFGEGMQRAAVDSAMALFWAIYVVGPGAILHGPTLLHFWLEFSKKGVEKLKIGRICAIYLPMVAILIIRLFYPRLMIVGVERHNWGYSVIGTPLYRLYTLLLAAYIATVIILAFRAAIKSQGNYREQARNIAIGILLSLIVAIITQIIFPIINISMPELSVISTFFFIFFIAYAINKYGLLQITTKIISDNIIDTMDDYLVVLDNDFKIVIISRSLLVLGEYSRSEMIGRPISEIVNSKIFHMKFDLIKNKLPLLNHQAKLTGFGKVNIPVSVNISLLKDGGREPIGLVLVMRDMREINSLIDNLNKRKEELEAKNVDLKRFNELAIGREIQMIKLKDKLKEFENESETDSESP